MTEQERDGWTQKAAEHVKRYPPGPWHDEPHRKDFKHAGLACLLSRSPGSGGWCGYVGVPPDHPLHGKHYHDSDSGGGVSPRYKSPEPLDVRLRERRLRLYPQLTIREYAESILGVPYRTYEGWELGARAPKGLALEALEKKLKPRTK